MKYSVNDSQFLKDMNNIVEYSFGFLDGVKMGKQKFLDTFGNNLKNVLEEFIDSNARVDPATLSHVYEWYEPGNPGARLFDIKYTVRGNGISIGSTFRQSTSIENGSKEPFYDKARIMEQGIPVTITPKDAKVLSFDVDGEQVFTSRPVLVDNPGGDAAQGGFKNILELFFKQYLSQAILSKNGILGYFEKPTAYKKNFAAGARGGRTTGVNVGYNWIIKAGENL
jgi:hypothetical protein